jgi:protein-S-isoprenylcysteine O-methyltransferase Ste14
LPFLALILLVGFLALTLGVRMAIQKRRTGATGFVGISGRPGSAEWIGGVVFASSLVLAAVAPVLDLAGVVEPIDALDKTWIHILGLVIGGIGGLGVFYAQGAMGAAWRVGVEEGERTDLVTEGPFRLVRNPIYSAMIPSMVGYALLVGNAVALAALAAIVIGLEMQVRMTEEPYLLRTHGEAFRSYAARVGRFVPGVGLFR